MLHPVHGWEILSGGRQECISSWMMGRDTIPDDLRYVRIGLGGWEDNQGIKKTPDSFLNFLSTKIKNSNNSLPIFKEIKKKKKRKEKEIKTTSPGSLITRQKDAGLDSSDIFLNYDPI